MSWFSRLFEPEPQDELGGELRAALATLVKRALDDGGDGLVLTTWRCNIRGIPVGSWRFTVERVPDKKRAEDGT